MHGNSMNVSVKNNLKLLRKRGKLKHRLGGYNPNNKTEYNLPKATPKQLKDIKKRMKTERKVWWVKIIGLTIVLTTVLVYGVIALDNLNF